MTCVGTVTGNGGGVGTDAGADGGAGAGVGASAGASAGANARVAHGFASEATGAAGAEATGEAGEDARAPKRARHEAAAVFPAERSTLQSREFAEAVCRAFRHGLESGPGVVDLAADDGGDGAGASAGTVDTGGGGDRGGSDACWECAACTYRNREPKLACEMCGTQRP
eukprot:g2760.t1